MPVPSRPTPLLTAALAVAVLLADPSSACTQAPRQGLLIDLDDPGLYGTLYTGPNPFESGEADYDYTRYRHAGPITGGRGLLRIDKFLDQTQYNANDWPLPGGQMMLASRRDLYRRRPQAPSVHYRYFDGVCGFRRTGKAFKPIFTPPTAPERRFIRTSQTGVLLLRTRGEALAATFWSVTRQRVDPIPDLISIKRWR